MSIFEEYEAFNHICYLYEKSKLSMLFYMLNYLQDQGATGIIQVILFYLICYLYYSIAFMYFVFCFVMVQEFFLTKIY